MRFLTGLATSHPIVSGFILLWLISTLFKCWRYGPEAGLVWFANFMVIGTLVVLPIGVAVKHGFLGWVWYVQSIYIAAAACLIWLALRLKPSAILN